MSIYIRDMTNLSKDLSSNRMKDISIAPSYPKRKQNWDKVGTLKSIHIRRKEEKKKKKRWIKEKNEMQQEGFSELKVLKSAAGFYVGTELTEDGVTMPYSRDLRIGIQCRRYKKIVRL